MLATKPPLIQCGLALFLLVAGNVYAQSAIVKADEVLREEATATASGVGNIAANAKVEIVERKGFWAKVKQGGSQGWLKLTALSIDSGASPGGISALAGIASGRTGGGNIVNASGTRGLSSEELKAAQPDMNALALIKTFAVTSESAQQFGQQAGLSSRQIKYIEPPKAIPSSNSTTSTSLY